MSGLKKSGRVPVGSRFAISWQLPAPPEHTLVRMDDEGIFTCEHDDFEWLREAYQATTEYVCLECDDEAGVLLASSLSSSELILIANSLVDEADEPSPALSSAVLCRIIVFGDGETFMCEHVAHRDLIGQKIGDGVDMCITTSDNMGSFNEAWDWAYEVAQIGLDGRRMEVSHA